MAFALCLMLIPFALSAFALAEFLRSFVSKAKQKRRNWLIKAAIIADLIFLLALVDAWLIEPRLITVTRISAQSNKIEHGIGDLKLIHISDIHFERTTPLTRKVIRIISRERPDMILITGDLYQNGDYNSSQFHDFLSRLCSVAPTFFVAGYDDERSIVKASGGKAVFVGDKTSYVAVRGTPIRIIGLGAVRNRSMRKTGKGLTIALSHSPDFAEDAVKAGADWYLAGHTHGGQIRLPFWGAIITNAATGKQYEYGLYHIGKTSMFVTRGIGLEPKPAPQMRFLCPPEVVEITLRSKDIAK